MSPTMAIVRPARSSPRRSVSVSVSSRACVGCSCAPSPALITAETSPTLSTARARSSELPALAWRMMMAAGSMAASVRPVSHSDSPLLTLEEAEAMLTTCAPSRWAAISKLARVRVLAS